MYENQTLFGRDSTKSELLKDNAFKTHVLTTSFLHELAPRSTTRAAVGLELVIRVLSFMIEVSAMAGPVPIGAIVAVQRIAPNIKVSTV